MQVNSYKEALKWANCAGMDAAKKRMRKADRTVMSLDDYNHAVGSLIVLGGLVISNKFGAGLIVLGATFMIISLLPLAGVWLENSTTELAITNKKVIAKWGFISRKTLEQRLEKVDSIQVDQSMTGRFFDYGTIIVHGSGSSTTPIKAIANPLEFRRQVENAVAGLGHPKG